jgi:SAM-dependent methyltransferase
VGSQDVGNGSYRALFSENDFDYVGADMSEGNNVDVVLKSPYQWAEFETDSFDIVISGQAFEHIEFFWLTMSEIARVLKKDGLVCVIAPRGFDEHRYPVDCYRFFTDGMVALARYVSFEVLHAHTNCAPSGAPREWYSQSAADSVLVATKPYTGEVVHPNMSEYTCIPSDHASLRGKLICESVKTDKTAKKQLNYYLHAIEHPTLKFCLGSIARYAKTKIKMI